MFFPFVYLEKKQKFMQNVENTMIIIKLTFTKYYTTKTKTPILLLAQFILRG